MFLTSLLWFSIAINYSNNNRQSLHSSVKQPYYIWRPTNSAIALPHLQRTLVESRAFFPLRNRTYTRAINSFPAVRARNKPICANNRIETTTIVSSRIETNLGIPQKCLAEM